MAVCAVVDAQPAADNVAYCCALLLQPVAARMQLGNPWLSTGANTLLHSIKNQLDEA
jgi:hypothetical protein